MNSKPSIFGVQFSNCTKDQALDRLDEFRRFGVASAGLDLRKRPAAVAKMVGEMCVNPSEKTLGKLSEMCGSSFTKGLYIRGV